MTSLDNQPPDYPFDLDELTKCSDEQLDDIVRYYGGIEDAAIAIGQQLAAKGNGEMHIDTTTIANWLVSRTAG